MNLNILVAMIVVKVFPHVANEFKWHGCMTPGPRMVIQSNITYDQLHKINEICDKFFLKED